MHLIPAELLHQIYQIKILHRPKWYYHNNCTTKPKPHQVVVVIVSNVWHASTCRVLISAVRRFETSTIIQNFLILTVTNFLLI